MIKTPKYNWYGRGFKLRAAITIVCQLAFVLFGYDQGVFSGIVGNQNFLDTFGHPSPALEGIIVAIYNLGCFTGCILSFIFCEKTGRRLAMWIAMGFIIVRIECMYLNSVLTNDRSARLCRPQHSLYHTSWLLDLSPVSARELKRPLCPCIRASCAKPTNEVDWWHRSRYLWVLGSRLHIGLTMA
jgi:hypothetical protein